MPRGRLFRKYVIVFVALVSGALLASGLLEIYFSYQENKAALVSVQREKAIGAASRIEGFIREIERQIGWTTQPQLVAPSAALEQRRFDYLRLLRQVLPITEIAHLDAAGLEQLRVSRLAMDVVGSRIDYSADPRFREAKAGRTYYGPVYFRKESEPYMRIAMPVSGGGGVTVADVNLKFIWDVVSQIKIGKAGRAFVVDGQGALIAHPDISLVLQKTTLSSLTQVRNALASSGTAGPARDEVTIARDLQGKRVLTAHSIIPTLAWAVFVEQPLEEAFEPLRASIQRTILLVLLGVGLAVVASLILARRMVHPIRTLQEGAAKIGAGELGHRLEIRTGDELEALAGEFNKVTTRLRETYATLEQKVEERTRELSESLEQQTATGEILGVISSSPTDVQPVFDRILAKATELCRAELGILFLGDGEALHAVALRGATPGFAEFFRQGPIRPMPGSGVGRVAATRELVHIADVASEAIHGERDPLRVATVELGGARTFLAVPMLKEGSLAGIITIYRQDVRPFSDKQIVLVKTFADQAVIAIENVRLFTELQARTRDLARSVEELQALGEVGQAVSSTLDVQTVLTTIVSRAVTLSGTAGGTIYEYDEANQVFHLRATHGMEDPLVAAQRAEPIRVGEGAVGKAVATRAPVQVSDIRDTTRYENRLQPLLIELGYRSVLAVPLHVEDRTLGALVVVRREAGDFSPATVNLLQTLATQSAIAIQNARLFRELEDKGHELEVANRHKSEFLANMSHELRTPLNAVIGFSEVLLERMFGELNDKQEEYLQDILASGRHLLSLINDILDLSKIEAGRMELELSDFDLPQALDNALTLVRERANRRGIALDHLIGDGVGPFTGDERKIKQVLLNLLSNAVKFTPEGGRIGVRATLNNGSVEISVTDTGVGIAPEDHEAVFEEFRQVGTDEAKKREGTGLGLALARRFVELHGGKLWLESQVGHGSTFTFNLPIRVPAAARAGRP
jgi:signal transduction histidine kinase